MPWGCRRPPCTSSWRSGSIPAHPGRSAAKVGPASREAVVTTPPGDYAKRRGFRGVSMYKLSEEHEMLRDLVKKFVRNELMPLEKNILDRFAAGQPAALSD